MHDGGALRPRVFLLSPANINGTRGSRALAATASFAVARQLRSRDGVALGDLFAFISQLYFRGKLTYARRFAAPPEPDNAIVGSGVLVITATAGLRSPETRVTAAAVRRFAGQDIDADNSEYRAPLVKSARELAGEIGDCDVVLLGSVASPKYVDVLVDVFGDRLLFPTDFVGRGDMSRGGLLLRQAALGVELPYGPVRGAVRRGRRPPKLEPQWRAAR
jgi:hypothetical protein